MVWTQIPLYVLDFEGSRKSGVLEIGAALLENGDVVDAFTALCAPAAPPTAGETRCHGLRAEDLAGAPPFAAHFSRFKTWRMRGLFAAHNALTERRLLCDAFPHPGYVPDFAAASQPLVAQWGPWVDSCALYRRIYPDLPSHTLGDLTAVFGLESSLRALADRFCQKNRKKPHCALYDALASALLLGRLQAAPPTSALSLPQFRALADPFSRQYDARISLL